MSGLETIFNSLGQSDVDGDYKFTDNNGKKHKFTDQFFSKEMKLAIRDQLFSQTKARQFNDPQEAIAIGKFLHKGLFGGTIKKVFSDYEATPKDYLLTETKKQEKKDKEAAEREARGEKEEAPKGKPKAIPRSDFPMYDLALGFPPNTEHVLLDQMLTTLPGKTYVVVPTADDIKKNPDLRNIGLTIFEGKNGNPHIIYSPAVSDKKVTGSQVARNFAVSMKLSGESNPKVKQDIIELGAKISNAMSPMSLLERYSLDHQFKLSPSLTEKASEGVNPLDFVNAGLESGELLTPFESLQLTEEEKTTLSEAITKQFMEASRLASELMIYAKQRSSVENQLNLNFKGTTFTNDEAFTESLVLISEVLSNPKAKHLLDMAFLDGDVDQITGTELKPELEVEIMDFIRNFGGVVTTDDRNVFNEEKADEDSTEGLQEQAPQIQNSIGEANPVSLSPIDRALYEIASKRGDTEEANRIWSKDAWPSDTTLFNFLTSMIVEGKRENGGLDEAAHAASADALDMPMRDVLEDSKDEFTSPTVGEDKAQQGQAQLDPSAAFKKASRIYVGEARSLTQPSNGTRTFLNVSFSKPRIENMNASVVALVPGVKGVEASEGVDEVKAYESIQSKLRTEGVSIIDGYKAEKNLTQIPPGTKLPSGQISIPLNDAFMAQLEEVLPSGEVALAMREERESIEALERNLVVRSLQRQKLQEKLEELKEGATKEEFRNNPGAQRKAIDKLVRIYERYSEAFLSENNKFNGVGSLLNKHMLDDFRTTGARAYLGMANANVNAIKQLLQERKSITVGPDPSTDQEVDPEASIRVEEINNEIREQVEIYNGNVNAFNSRIKNAIKRFGSRTHFMIAPEVVKELKLKLIGETEEDYTVESLSELNFEESGSIYAKVDVFAQEAAIQSVIDESVFKAFGEEAHKAFVPNTSTKPGKNGKVVDRKKAKKLFGQIRDLKRNQKKSVETIINGMRLDGKYSNDLQELLEVFALSDAEISEMVSNGARSAVATKKMNELDNSIWTLSREIDKTETHLNKVSNVDGETSFHLGRTAYVDGDLKVGIDINMTAGSYPQTYEESMDQPAPEHVLRERRKDYAIKRAAMLKVLNHFSSVQLQDAYDFAKKGATMSEDFNPISTIAKAIAINKVQNQIVAERFGQAVSDRDLADARGMDRRQLAMLLDPASDEFQALTANEQGRIKILHMPESFKEREAALGRYFEHDGLSIVMMPTNAKEELMRMHPTTVNRRNVNSLVKDIVLASKGFGEQAPDSTEPQAYFIEALNNIRKDLYPYDNDGPEFRLAKEGATLGEVAEAFSGEYGRLIQEALNKLRNKNNVAQGKIGKKEVDLTGYMGAQQLNDYKKMIEFIVISLGHPRVTFSKDTELKTTITNFLNKIEAVGKDNFANINDETGDATGLAGFHVEETFAIVLSAVEADMISKRITMGLTIEDNSIYDFNMKYTLHQDARIRNRNRNSYVARQASQHLTSILSHGFIKGGGKYGYETASRKIKQDIAEASEKVQGKGVKGKLSGADNYNQTLGYMIAMLRGLSESNGQSLTLSFTNWRKAISLGFDQNRMFIGKQKNVKVGALMEKAGLGNVSRYWNGNHIDLVRDNELAEEMERILKELNIIGDNAMSISPANGQTADERTQEMIGEIEKALLTKVKGDKATEVGDYAGVIHKSFKDIDAAMHLTVAMQSTPQEVEGKTQNYTKETISSVPIRLAYTANPASKERIQEGKFIADPLDMVKITDSSFFGGNVASDNTYQKKGVFRPIAINGISAPISLVDDAVYRLKVAPTYSVLRKAIGKVETNRGINTVNEEESGMLTHLKASNTPVLQPHETDNQFKKRQRDFLNNLKETKTAFAGIAIELETVLQNDMQRGVVNTGGAEVMRVLGSFYVVRALASAQQLWDQSASASMGYTAGKLASGNAKSAGMYWKLLGKMMTDKVFSRAAREYIKNNSPYVFYRAAEGADIARDQIRGQRRFGRNKIKTGIGKAVRSLEQGGEFVLDKTIATGERLIASTIFFVELAEQMNGDISMIEKIVKPGSTVEPTVQQINNAQIKVNDMMGQSDQAKKAWFFQTRDKNPTINSLWRSIVRFSNHTASTSANTAVMSRSTFGEAPEGVSAEDWQRNKQESRENVVSSLVQNALFFPMKIKNLTVIMAMAYFMAMGDDDDEAARKAQKFANKALVPDEDSNIVAKVAKILLAGSERELFQSDSKIDDAQASALAEIMSKSLIETSTVIPYVGSLIGYSPVSGFLAKTFTNDVSRSVSAAVMDVEKNDVFIRQYNSDALESGADLTNPTSVVYDYAQATKLMVDYGMTRHAARNRGQSTFDLAVYFMTEVLPFLREARSYYGKELREVVKKETRKKRR